MPEDQINSTDSPEEILDDSPLDDNPSEHHVINPILAKNSVLFPEEKPKKDSAWVGKAVTGFAASVLLFLTLCAVSLGVIYTFNPDAIYELLGSAVSEFIAPDSDTNQSGKVSPTQRANSARPDNNSDAGSEAESEGDSSQTGSSDADSASSNTYSRDDWPEGKLLGTSESDKYHSGNCMGAQQIPPENEIWYDSVEAAEADNRSPCGICYG